jgi:hypothetical protein
MTILESVQRNFPAIDRAARPFMLKLSMTGIQTDIALAAEMAGLALLRTSAADLSKVPAGTVILGAVPDAVFATVNRFIFGWSKLNGLPAPTAETFESLLAEAKAYHPELTRFEKPFDDVCAEHTIARELRPFVAATTALLLVVSGQKLSILDPKIGLAMVAYHFVSGCKTMPYPPAAEESGSQG